MMRRRTLSRRGFVAGTGALAAIPFLSRTCAAADIDVVVVGAGPAGLAATRELVRRGMSVVTLEAAARVGARPAGPRRAAGAMTQTPSRRSGARSSG